MCEWQFEKKKMKFDTHTQTQKIFLKKLIGIRKAEKERKREHWNSISKFKDAHNFWSIYFTHLNTQNSYTHTYATWLNLF